MAKRRRAAGPLKTFTNLEAVFSKMEEFGFFINSEHRAEQFALLTDPTPSPGSTNEHWYSNGADELKIFRLMFGAYELCNFRGMLSTKLDELFELAEMPKIG